MTIKILNSEIKNVKGDDYTIVQPCNLYDCFLSPKVFVGPFCEIQSCVWIGEKTRIQSHSFICSFVKIGRECFIGHGAMFVNDLMRHGKVDDHDHMKETILGNNVIVGTNATILPVSICSNVIIGAGSVVTKNITEPGTYVGNPEKIKNSNKEFMK